MKYKDRDEFVASLREMADFFEARGHELPIEPPAIYMTGYVRQYDARSFTERAAKDRKRDVKTLIRAFKPVRKKYYDTTFHIVKKFGRLEMTISVSRGVVCKAVPTGNKIITEAQTQTIPRSVRDEVEWVCTDPVLKETA